MVVASASVMVEMDLEGVDVRRNVPSLAYLTHTSGNSQSLLVCRDVSKKANAPMESVVQSLEYKECKPPSRGSYTIPLGT